MGCGSSISASQHTKQEIIIRSSLQSSIKKPKETNKTSIEDARRRREEGAKERTRRASVMGMLEAEKLKQRKLSNASINNIPVACEKEENIHNLEKDDERSSDITKHENKVDLTNESNGKVTNRAEDPTSNLNKPIQIIISPDTRSNSVETVNA